MDKQKIAKRLSPWSEIAGSLEAVQEEDGLLVACLNSGRIVVPDEMAEELQGYLGKRIAILRTDMDYRIRELPPIPVEHIVLEVHLNRVLGSWEMGEAEASV